jgi:hypothetical protein
MTEFELIEMKYYNIVSLDMNLKFQVSVAVAIIAAVPPTFPGCLHLKDRQSQKARLQHVDVQIQQTIAPCAAPRYQNLNQQ